MALLRPYCIISKLIYLPICMLFVFLLVITVKPIEAGRSFPSRRLQWKVVTPPRPNPGRITPPRGSHPRRTKLCRGGRRGGGEEEECRDSWWVRRRGKLFAITMEAGEAADAKPGDERGRYRRRKELRRRWVAPENEVAAVNFRRC
ncbi:hypothetical protein DM860_011960 [Cuscuta australis]|uniref:Uncharacterized protein n=1 Tax=Cuscuta australis TaxID=267555 RepID=A0A328D8N5_9ASTE|nr:hypothetical protein DM860_011960 [Cuscuta australis]